jgi:calcineurin-like phosphoesterase family protein
LTLSVNERPFLFIGSFGELLVGGILMQFVISDTHYFHADLLGDNDFAPRLFPNVEAMNQQMITAWNERVAEHDTVYHLGDIALRPHDYLTPVEIAGILAQLNGHIVLIKGNHDYRDLFKYLAQHNPILPDGQVKYTFHDVGIIVKFDHNQFFLTHYPLLFGITHQTYNLHGHIHHNMMPTDTNINIGVDAPERQWVKPTLPFGAPLTFAEVMQMIAGKKKFLAAQSH